MEKRYDIIIVGCGPAGMTAGIYAKRAGMNCVIIEKMAPGGQVAQTSVVENYTGFKKIDGFELSQKMFEHVQSLGIEVVFDTVDNIQIKDKIKVVHTQGDVYTAPVVILAMGASSRALGVDNEKQYLGRGISYCAVCDGAFFKGKTVAVVGGGNTALQDISYLSNIVDKVIHINRRDEFRADSANIANYDKILNAGNKKVEQYLGYVVEKLNGDNRLESIEVRNLANQSKETIKLDGLFVAIGRVPQTEILDAEINTDANGYIMVDENMKTSVDGVYAIGDIIHKSLRQIATAINDGAIAGISSSVYVKKGK